MTKKVTDIDVLYCHLLATILEQGTKVTTRNSEVISHCELPQIVFETFPLVTIRKPAAMKSIHEMAWFMGGKPRCPDILKDWWDGQLNSYGELLGGYGEQFRNFTNVLPDGEIASFDQVKFILEGLRNNPNSRRLVMTTWNPAEMACITETNKNPKTPTCCHSVVVQFFVRDDKLSMFSYQRSADCLLGVPHNWIQSWAMLTYFAYHAGLKVGTMRWSFGDAHIYLEDSHIDIVTKMLEAVTDTDTIQTPSTFSLKYAPENPELDGHEVPVFKATDFHIEGDIPDALVTGRPKLL